MVVQVRRVILVLAAQDAVPANLAHRVAVGEFRVRDVARGAVRALAPGTPVTPSVAGALPGLGSWLQYCDHVRRVPPRFADALAAAPGTMPGAAGFLTIDCCRGSYQFQIAATRYASWVFDSRTSTISAGTSPRIPSAMIQFRISWSPESCISSGLSSASLLPFPARTISR